MGVLIANEPLVAPTSDVRDWINRNISTTSFLPWQRMQWPGNTLSGLTSSFGGFPESPIQINKFFYPTGASRWGYGHFLATDNNIINITESSGDPGWLDDKYKKVRFHMDTQELVSDETNYLGNQGLDILVYVLPPTPLSGMPVDINQDANNIYLLTVVDPRYYWWYKNTGELIVNSLSIPDWPTLYSELADKLGIVLDVDDIDKQYLWPSPDFNLSYVPIPPVLDAIAFNVGQRIVPNQNGNYHAINYTNSIKDLNTDFSNHPTRTVRAGWQRFPSNFPPLLSSPFFDWADRNNFLNIEKVNVKFKGYKCLGKRVGSFPTSYVSTWTNPNVSGSGIELTIEDNCRAYFEPDNTGKATKPVNKDALDQLAQIFGRELMQWKQISFDIVFNGTLCITANGTIDTIEYAYLEDDAYTRIYSYPWNYDPIQLCHYDWANECHGIGNRFIATDDIAPGASAMVTTQLLNDSGSWVSTATAAIYSPTVHGTFAAGDEGVVIVDIYGNLIIVQEDCGTHPSATATG